MPNYSFNADRMLDAGVAALAALSAGFVVYAMPDSLFSSLIGATPLPDMLPAARPPLGETARYAAVVTAALLAFGSVLALFAVIDRLPRRRNEAAPAEVEGEGEFEAPRLRRADAHPDAPARRPLVAGRDLGEPLELDVPAEAPTADVAPEPEPRPLPAFLVPEEATEPQPEVVCEPEPELEPLSELAARVPEVEVAGEDESLSQLVNRIESGLSKKQQALPSAPPLEPPAQEEPKVGHRLRSAISELQKISAQGA